MKQDKKSWIKHKWRKVEVKKNAHARTHTHRQREEGNSNVEREKCSIGGKKKKVIQFEGKT